MLEALSSYEVIMLLAGLVGVYMKLNSDVLKLKSRVLVLERSETEVQKMLKDLLTAVNDIKILLAEHGIKAK
jgi:hypothetical protein